MKDQPLPTAYASAGVDIDAGNRAVELMKTAIRRTHHRHVLSEIGSFGGLFSTAAYQEMEDPILVATTDGVGTKVALAAQAGRYSGIGTDIVNHCANDLLVQGARPLFFLDYVASGKLDPEKMAAIVGGMAEACLGVGCALLGGETAEMPGVYAPVVGTDQWHFDVVGTMVGVVDRACLFPRPDIRVGDRLVGLASSGPHTNGYSLIRKVIADLSLDEVFPELGAPLVDVLLASHRSYAFLLDVFQKFPGGIKGLAHITGGGFYDNIPRILPAGLGANIQPSWPVPPLFSLIQRLGKIRPDEMFRVFNMGIGMVLVVEPTALELVQQAIPEQTWVIGEVAPQAGVSIGLEV